MSKKETPAKAPEKKSAFQKAAAMAKAKQAEKKNANKEKTNIFQKAARFFKEMKSEAKKIVWPSKKQVINNTGIVLIVIALCGVVLWPMDWLLLQLFNLMF